MLFRDTSTLAVSPGCGGMFPLPNIVTLFVNTRYARRFSKYILEDGDRPVSHCRFCFEGGAINFLFKIVGKIPDIQIHVTQVTTVTKVTSRII